VWVRWMSLTDTTQTHGGCTNEEKVTHKQPIKRTKRKKNKKTKTDKKKNNKQKKKKKTEVIKTNIKKGDEAKGMLNGTIPFHNDQPSKCGDESFQKNNSYGLHAVLNKLWVVWWFVELLWDRVGWVGFVFVLGF